MSRGSSTVHLLTTKEWTHGPESSSCDARSTCVHVPQQRPCRLPCAARLLRPVVYGDAVSVTREAERDLSQLTEAWNVVQRAGEKRGDPALASAEAGWGPPAELGCLRLESGLC